MQKTEWYVLSMLTWHYFGLIVSSVTCHCHSQIHNKPIKSCENCPDILRYQVTDLIWLGYHNHLVELRYGKYLTVCFSGIKGLFGLAVGILARLRLLFEPWLDQTCPICRWSKQNEKLWLGLIIRWNKFLSVFGRNAAFWLRVVEIKHEKMHYCER